MSTRNISGFGDVMQKYTCIIWSSYLFNYIQPRPIVMLASMQKPIQSCEDRHDTNDYACIVWNTIVSTCMKLACWL